MQCSSPLLVDIKKVFEFLFDFSQATHKVRVRVKNKMKTVENFIHTFLDGEQSWNKTSPTKIKGNNPSEQ